MLITGGADSQFSSLEESVLKEIILQKITYLLIKGANNAYEADSFDNAIHYYGYVIINDPTSSHAHHNLGCMYLDLYKLGCM